MPTRPLPLVVGLPGTTIDHRELAILDYVRPAGVILFDRNVDTPEQVIALLDGLGELEPRPFVAVDLEGGAVNRLTRLWGDLPSPSQAGAVGGPSVRALGEAIGAACRHLGIHLDLAPVVDLDRPQGVMAAQGRCFSDDPSHVVSLAREFHAGLAEWGISGCLKHYPGLGPVAIDTHEELAALPEDEPSQPHLAVFGELSELIPVVMVAHVVAPDLGDANHPASLSRTIVNRAAALPGAPVVLSDDLEMGALAGRGELPELVARALEVRNHGVLVCKAFDRLEEIAHHLDATAAADPAFGARVEEMTSRLGTLRSELERRMAAVPAPDFDTVNDLWDKARRSVE
jgi:beta-N-acetylhexosaminidase